MSARTVLSSDDIDRAVTRIAHEILEANTALQKSGTSNLVILGIPTRGVLLAEGFGDDLLRPVQVRQRVRLSAPRAAAEVGLAKRVAARDGHRRAVARHHRHRPVGPSDRGGQRDPGAGVRAAAGHRRRRSGVGRGEAADRTASGTAGHSGRRLRNLSQGRGGGREAALTPSVRQAPPVSPQVLRQARYRRIGVHVDHRERRFRDVRLGPGQHLEQHHAKTVQVAAFVERRAMSLLGAHVMGCADYCAYVGHARVGGKTACDTKIRQHRRIIGTE